MLWVGRVVAWWVGMDVEWWVVEVRGVGLYSYSSLVGWGVGILRSFLFWVRSVSIFLLSLKFSYLSASISSALHFLKLANSCCILACPPRIATKFRLLPVDMLSPTSGSFEILALLCVETSLASSQIVVVSY